MTKTPVGVLASGSGTNLQALIDACADPAFPARIAVVLSNKADAFALERARKAGIATELFPNKAAPTREGWDALAVEVLRGHAVQWVCLAGFMRIVTPVFIEGMGGRVLNIHPSLLPAFPGLHAQRQAVEHGVRVSGATVHLVDAGCDTGPILVQGAVEVRGDDDEAALQQRILAVEHRIYPQALRIAVEGRFVVDGRRARVRGEG
jgi:phosphoribosylglycinamide formyltransferase 1